MTPRVRIRKIKGSVSVGGTVFPIAQCTSSYARNNIPSCSVVIPLGQTSSGARRTLRDVLEESSGARVSLDVTVDGELTFKGYVTGNSFLRDAGTAGVQITGASFLGDMHATSALSSSFSAMIPGKMILPVSRKGGATSQHAIGAVNTWNMEKLPDLWALFRTSADAFKNAPEATSAALAAVTGSSVGGGTTTNPLIEGNKLGIAALSTLLGDLVLNPFGEQMRTPIAATVNEIILGDEGGQTLFTKLLTCATNFGFSFIPRVRDGLVVAAFPFSRDVGVTISKDEYERIEASMQRPFPTSAVALMGTGQLATVGKDSAPTVPKRVGYYDSGIKGGVLHLQSAIKWLNGLSAHPEKTRATSGVETPRFVGRPRTGTRTVSEAREVRDSVMGDAYAKWIWNNIAYANRSAPVSAAYRTDICPGSSVLLYCPDFKGQVPLYGFVEAVTLAVDAMSATAKTTLLLSSVRTSKEMGSAQSGHPLFQTTFLGDTLVAA